MGKKRNSFSLKINKVLNNFPILELQKFLKIFIILFIDVIFLDFNKMRNKISRENLIFHLKT